MTLTNLQAKVRQLTQTDSNSYDSTSLNQNLNNHYQRIQQLMDDLNQGWYETITGTGNPQNLTAGTRTYAIPTDSMRIIKVQAKLDGATWVDIQEMKKGEITSSIEQESDVTDVFDNVVPRFVLEGLNIRILSGTISTVTNGLRFHYIQRQADLSSGSDVPAFPNEYHTVLAYGAAADYFYSRQNLDRGDRWNAKVEGMLQEMRVMLSRRSSVEEMNMGVKSSRENYD